MSFALSLHPVSHVFGDHLYNRSYSLTSETASTCTLQCHGCRHASDSSNTKTLEDASHFFGENRPPPRFSKSATIVSRKVERPTIRKAASQLPLQTVLWRSESPLSIHPPSPNRSTLDVRNPSLEGSADSQSVLAEFGGIARPEDLASVVSVISRTCQTGIPLPDDPETERLSSARVIHPTTHKTYTRWLNTLRRRHQLRQLNKAPSRWPLADADQDLNSVDIPEMVSGMHTRISTSESSSHALVTAVRSATVTLAETSIAPMSWIGGRLGHLRRARLSWSGQGSSDSNSTLFDSNLDEVAWTRAVQRRKILEELIESEESYVADLKVLVNVYFTLLASVDGLSSRARDSIRENVAEILQLHEGLLGDLYEVVPHSEYNQNHAKEPPAFHPKGHVRWHSADSVPGRTKDLRLGRKLRHSIDIARPVRACAVASTAEPKIAAAVARVFDKHMKGFFAYEEYGAKYEMMVRDLAATYKTLSRRDAFEKGIEILSRTLESIRNREEHSRKGLTFGDLVIKPIQRVCKYPLLFADLCKHTPVGDDPLCNAEITKVLLRLKEITREINKATDDPKTRDMLEKTWLLQDRLIFPDQPSSLATSRLLGQMILCGVLHVAYQSRNGLVGQYMLCALFKSYLLLATGNRGLTSFTVVAIVPLANISMEEPDNGKGMQCHTAPNSWKIVFEADHRLFELLLSACSPAEEEQWKKYINERSCIESLEIDGLTSTHHDLCSSLSLDLKPIGSLYGQPHTLARRISIRRAATLGPKSQMSQVIVRNTQSSDLTSAMSSSTSLPIGRSRSVPSNPQLPILAPRRSERIQLESALSDVWTKDVLPFPGMRQQRSDNTFRASANSVMRKLSMASITSSFSRRSSSYPFVNPHKTEQGMPSTSGHVSAMYQSHGRSAKLGAITRPSAPATSVLGPPLVPIVNFQETPDMFLPPDFELRDSRGTKLPKKNTVTLRAVDNEQRPSKVGPIKKKSTQKLKRSMSMQTPLTVQASNQAAGRAPAVEFVAGSGARSHKLSMDMGGRKENVAVVSGTGTFRPSLKGLRRLFP